MKISILTLFPEMFRGTFDHSIIKNAQEKNKVQINFVNIRDFGIGRHKVVDDKPYGGGHGMILRVDVLEKAIRNAKDKSLTTKNQKVALLSPHGKTFKQEKAQELSNLEHLILVCGRYEGVDERLKQFTDEEISVGDFITTGGEIPAMLITDAVVRLIKGVLKEGVTSSESFSLSAGEKTIRLEYPQYTKPQEYKNLSVPPILLGGNHNKIKKWRSEKSIKATRKLRPDLLR
ncbi:MAG: tRNA (guanosine(37)-N1)-methyltransferase TrmD [Candidatus Levybacteria bacterium]|nr:tRNA (guanosine(37)-N1)-methyltransferase TrmD [Candidatus Levybacteria bacterium]